MFREWGLRYNLTFFALFAFQLLIPSGTGSKQRLIGDSTEPSTAYYCDKDLCGHQWWWVGTKCSDRTGMEGEGGVPQDHLDPVETSEEANEKNDPEEEDVSEVGSAGPCPSCGAPAPCSTWLKITLGFTAAKTVSRLKALPYPICILYRKS